LPPFKAIVLGFLFAIAISGAAYRAKALTISGAVAATIVGTVAFGWGGMPGAAALLLFFVSSTVLGRWRRGFKESLGFEKGGRRDAGQVFANGGVAAVCLMLSAFSGGETSKALWLAFLASLAGANADTWATEIGSAAGGRPFSLRRFCLVNPGASGAISLPGTAASLAGALVIGLIALIPHAGSWGMRGIFIVVVSGFTGSLLDSLAGAYIQAQWRINKLEPIWSETCPPEWAGRKPDRGLAWIRNDAVNFICTGSAAALAFALSRF